MYLAGKYGLAVQPAWESSQIADDLSVCVQHQYLATPDPGPQQAVQGRAVTQVDRRAMDPQLGQVRGEALQQLRGSVRGGVVP